MNEADIFKTICNLPYLKSGLDVDWYAEYDENENRVNLYFQGSCDPMDWIIDFYFPAKVYKHQENTMFIHRGFAKAWKSVNDEIVDEIRNLTESNTCYQVNVYGHSYGGALAQLAAEDIYYRLSIKCDVITFGAPKLCFGKRTVKYMKSCFNSIENYAHVNDIVPTVPPFFRNVKKVKIGENERKLFGKFDVSWHMVYGDPLYYV